MVVWVLCGQGAFVLRGDPVCSVLPLRGKCIALGSPVTLASITPLFCVVEQVTYLLCVPVSSSIKHRPNPAYLVDIA